jgi:hypothetical protein
MPLRSVMTITHVVVSHYEAGGLFFDGPRRGAAFANKRPAIKIEDTTSPNCHKKNPKQAYPLGVGSLGF